MNEKDKLFKVIRIVIASFAILFGLCVLLTILLGALSIL